MFGQKGPDVASRPMAVLQFYYDKVSAMLACNAVLSALHARNTTGRGQLIENSMFDSALYFLWPDVYQNKAWVSPDGSDDVASSLETLLVDALGGEKPSKIPTATEALEDPAVSRLRTFRHHTLFGGQYKCDFPAMLSKTPVPTREVAPMLGEHTVKITRDLGYSTSEVRPVVRFSVSSSTPPAYVLSAPQFQGM